MSKGFSLMEMMICVVIIAVLGGMAIPYYQNAVQSARNTEAVLWWSQVKRGGSIKSMTAEKAARWEKNANERMKHFRLEVVCREKTNPSEGETCWEANLHLTDPAQRIRYFLSTQQNFMQLVCVPLNSAGKNFCQAQAGNENEPDTEIDGKEAYLLRN